MKFWSVIKYKPKAGCEDEFVEALQRLNKMFEGRRECHCIRLPTGEFTELVRYENIDQMMALQVEGLTWLDSVDHLLELYDENSRTDAFSGNELDF